MEEYPGAPETYFIVSINHCKQKIPAVPPVNVSTLENMLLPIVKCSEYVEFKSASVRTIYNSVPVGMSMQLQVYD